MATTFPTMRQPGASDCDGVGNCDGATGRVGNKNNCNDYNNFLRQLPMTTTMMAGNAAGAALGK